MTAGAAALFLLCVAAATTAQNLTGFAFVLVLLGLAGTLQLAPLADLANVGTVLSLASALTSLAKMPRREVDRAAFRDATIGIAIGTVLGLLLLGWLSANLVVVLRLLLGLTVIGCAISVLVQSRAGAVRGSPVSFGVFGVLSGTLGGLFAASGPPLVYHFYRQPLGLEVVRGTLVACLASSSLLRLAIVVPTGQFSALALQLCLLAAPLVVVVTWALHRWPPPLSRAFVLRLVCALLLVTGAGLVVPAATQLLGS